MGHIAFIYFTIGFVVSLILFIAMYDKNNMKDKNIFYKILVYFIGILIIFLTWPVWVIMIIRIFYKINKENQNGQCYDR